MRVLTDIAIGIMAVAILVGGVWYATRSSAEAEQIHEVHAALALLQEQTTYHSAIRAAEEISTDGDARQAIELQWFAGSVPQNGLAPSGTPWIDLAPEGDLGLHPPDPILVEAHQAGFWYNPNNGIFRARVPQQTTEAHTLALYNAVNASGLSGLRESETVARRPIPYQSSVVASAESRSTLEMNRSRAVPRRSLITRGEP